MLKCSDHIKMIYFSVSLSRKSEIQTGMLNIMLECCVAIRISTHIYIVTQHRIQLLRITNNVLPLLATCFKFKGHN